MTVYQTLLDVLHRRGAGFLVLLDPDEHPADAIARCAVLSESQGADGILIGGSLMFNDGFDKAVETVKKSVRIPLILFPGNSLQLSRHADAVLFMSLLSGRNSHYLIGEQATAAPIVRVLGIEPIGMAYLLVESGTTTTAEFMSHTKPIPRAKPEIAAAHALAAEYLGMKLVYLEAGSGAEQTVPESMIRVVREAVSIPIVVGGGIRTPAQAKAKVEAGASFVVVGNALENNAGPDLVRAFADAIHRAAPAP
jgi:putative glycerol-1-phosphate prenyltransferase